MKRILLALPILLSASLAQAQTNTPTVTCLDPASGRDKLIYVSGASAAKTFTQVVAGLVKADLGYTVIYQAVDACVAAGTVLDPSAAKHLMKDIPAAPPKKANYAVFFNADGTATECFLAPEGNTVDVAITTVVAETCGFTKPANVADYEGPIQTYVFVVNTASSQTAISAEAAYLAFGYGGSDGQGHRSEPWTDPTYFQVRNKFSGNQQVCGKAIGVPAEKWKGNDLGSATNLATAMAQMLDTQGAEKAIGILSTDTSDAHRSTIRTLAFQASGATCSYLPDSTAQSFDKANVREGRYLMWSPLHFFTTTTSSIPSAQAGAMVTRFAAPKLDQGLLDSIIAGHLIPKCAMKVKRTQEMGPLQPLAPTDFRCGCYFDAKINGLDANQMATRYDCRACLGASDCPAAKPSCNYGYCEAN